MEIGIASMCEALRAGRDACVLPIIRKIVSYGDMNDHALEVVVDDPCERRRWTRWR